MNTPFNTTRTATRIAAFFAAAAVTTVLVSSQFSLAQHYHGEAGAQLAGQPAAGLLALASVQHTAG
jgi:hypothetical protein